MPGIEQSRRCSAGGVAPPPPAPAGTPPMATARSARRRAPSRPQRVPLPVGHVEHPLRRRRAPACPAGAGPGRRLPGQPEQLAPDPVGLDDGHLLLQDGGDERRPTCGRCGPAAATASGGAGRPPPGGPRVELVGRSRRRPATRAPPARPARRPAPRPTPAPCRPATAIRTVAGPSGSSSCARARRRRCASSGRRRRGGAGQGADAGPAASPASRPTRGRERQRGGAQDVPPGGACQSCVSAVPCAARRPCG